MERSKIAGVRALEILISYTFTNFAMLVVQSLIVIGLSISIYQLPVYGSFGLLFLIAFLQGYCGMSCGNDRVFTICFSLLWKFFLILKHLGLLYSQRKGKKSN